MSPAREEEGMVLVTVLLLVGVAAAALAIMLTGDDSALARARRFGGAAQAIAIARAGELSAIAALRRDMIVAPQSDDSTEPWAKIAERGAPIAGGGRFALAIEDATGKIDLNPIARGDPVALLRLELAEDLLKLKPGVAEQIVALLLATGPVSDLAELAPAGLDPPSLARLATVATVLPAPQPINLNAAPESVLALILGDPVAARALTGRRARAGRLTVEDFAFEHVAVPARAGFLSNLYWTRVRVSSGGATQQLTSLLFRRRGIRREPIVEAIARWPSSPPLQAPPLAEAAASTK